MAGEDRKVRVGIQLDKSGTGAADATKEIQALRDQAQKLQGDLERTVKAHEQASHAVHEHSLSHRQLHMAMHAVGELVPGLGQVMMLAFNPVTGVLMMLGVAARAFHEGLKEMNEEMKKAEEENVKPLTKTLHDQTEAFIEDAVAGDKFKGKLDEIAHAEMSVKEQVDAAVEAMKRQQQGEGKVGDSANSFAMQALETLHKMGLVSEAAYLSKKEQLNREYEEAKRRREEENLRREIEVREQGLRVAILKQAGLEDDAAKARERQSKAEMAVKRLGTQEQAEENLDKAREALKSFKGRHLEIEENEALGAEGIPLNKALAPEDYLEYTQLQNAVQQATTRRARFAGRSVRIQQELNRAKAEVALREGRATGNQQMIYDETRQQDIRGATLQGTQETNTRLNAQASNMSGLRQLEALKGTPQGNVLMENVMEYVGRQAQTFDQAILILMNLAANDKDFNAKLNMVIGQVSASRQQMPGNGMQ